MTSKDDTKGLVSLSSFVHGIQYSAKYSSSSVFIILTLMGPVAGGGGGWGGAGITPLTSLIQYVYVLYNIYPT